MYTCHGKPVVGVRVYTCCGGPVEVGKFLKVGSLLPTCGSQGLKLGNQVSEANVFTHRTIFLCSCFHTCFVYNLNTNFTTSYFQLSGLPCTLL